MRNGNCDVSDRLLTSRFTLSYVRSLPPASRTRMRPLDIVIFRTDTLIDVDVAVDDAPPSPEKFHCPAAERRSTTCGSSRWSAWTCRLREKISGSRSTPTVTAFAVTNGAALNA